MSRERGRPTSGRKIRIATRDKFGSPLAGAEIEVFISGRFLGRIFTGSGVAESTVDIGPLAGTVLVKVTAADGASKSEDVLSSDKIEITLDTAPLFKSKIPAIPTCPDGTTGSPCVICHDGEDTWQICA